MNEYSSKLLESAVKELSRLPGIGKRTALRLSLHLLREDPLVTRHLAEALMKMRDEIMFCKRCNNISDNELCDICRNPKRDEHTVCVVEDTRDVLAVENTAQFNGLYHVLGGIINPMEGIGPNDLNLSHLVERVRTEEIQEIILALPATVEGDTTGFYIFKLLSPFDIKITTLSRGVAIGNELEYTDEVTLGRSILNRLPFDEANRQ
ncbi:recombination mediator RecR [Candidatus Sulfidibacterium hydrothermale]|uniref:recombination mediator RecR n=1 Tax=Candidatus Sulfidibacterium hydrothermale TaxID=2875962 RepID=UPI001F0A2D30|nr:recombination mediator RecR [Candidatus Sulfidibacterium hydrothermale]UBM63175.1 recombination mediator RecR [Candidatus Sulfidibacterium hydrothermale]